jgi:serine/threonine protein phosphatase PrpC
VTESCRQVDQEFLKTYGKYAFNWGSTCVMVLVIGDRLICMNVGDSRALLCRNRAVVQLSKDHKPVDSSHPDRPARKRQDQRCARHDPRWQSDDGWRHRRTQHLEELRRLRVQAGIEWSGRQGRGPHHIEAGSSRPSPQIRELHLDFTKDDFIVLACDGLFETLSNSEVVAFIYDSMTDMSIGAQDCQKVAEDLVQLAVKKNIESKKESDNVSVIIVQLTRGIVRAEH